MHHSNYSHSLILCSWISARHLSSQFRSSFIVVRSIMLLQILLALAVNAEARINSPLLRRAGYPYSVATFNNYAAQGNTNCGPTAGMSSSIDLHLFVHIHFAALMLKVSDQCRSIRYIRSCGIRCLSRYFWRQMQWQHQFIKLQRAKSNRWHRPNLPDNELWEVLQSDQSRRYSCQRGRWWHREFRHSPDYRFLSPDEPPELLQDRHGCEPKMRGPEYQPIGHRPECV